MKHSIQWRLQVWHGAMLALVLMAFGWVSYRAAWLEELRRADGELADQFDFVLQGDGRPGGFGPGPGEMGPPRGGFGPPPMGFGPPPGRDLPGDRKMGTGKMGDRKKGPPPPGGARPGMVDDIRAEIGRNIWELERTRRGSRRNDYYLFIDHDGTIFARSSNAPPGVPFPAGSARLAEEARPALIPGGRTLTWEARSRGNYREVYRILPLGDAIVIGRLIDTAALQSQLVWVAAAGLGLLAAGLAGGWWLTRRALEPINAISRTAAEIASGDLTRRVEVESSESELGQLAGVLNHTFAQLQSSFERQQRFTSDASHELRTPIAVILSKAQMTLGRERSCAEYQEALRVCQRAAQRMRSLTESLLALSRMDAAQDQIGQEQADLAEVAADCLDFLQDRAAEKGVTLRAELMPFALRGDARRLSQVVTNLVTNAIQHTPAGGTVTVRTVEGASGEATLEVEDTGVGIADEDLPRVFDRFYRVTSHGLAPRAAAWAYPSRAASWRRMAGRLASTAGPAKEPGSG